MASQLMRTCSVGSVSLRRAVNHDEPAIRHDVVVRRVQRAANEVGVEERAGPDWTCPDASIATAIIAVPWR